MSTATEDRELLRRLIPTMEGWTTPERCLEMYDLILEFKPETVVEIGVFGGRTLIAMALAVRQNGIGKVYGMDPWKLEAAIEAEPEGPQKDWWKNVNLHSMHKLTMEAIWNNGLDEWAIVIRAASQHLPHLFPGGIGVLNLDGNHSEAASCRDVNNYVPQLWHNGLVFMDDTDWRSTQKAQSLILETCVEYRVGDQGHYKIYQRQLAGKPVSR